MVKTLAILCIGLSTITVAQRPALLGYYSGNGSDLEKHKVEQLSHLIWCFGQVRNDSMVIAPEQAQVLTQMVALRKRNPALKVLLSMGGWGGCANCSETFSREEGRKRFAATAAALIRLYGADGIDLDWEYPAVQGPPGHLFQEEDRHNFTLLVRELRSALRDADEISFAAGGTDECLLRGFEWDSIMPLVDRVHIMSYDLVHGYSKRTGHHTALYSTTGQELSASHAVDLLLEQGVPRNKIIIGCAFYARVFKQVGPEDNGLFQPGTFSHAVPFAAFDSTFSSARGWHMHLDQDAMAPYAYNARDSLFATFDLPVSLVAKARYARQQGLGGAMFWQLAEDRPLMGLLDTLYKALGHDK